MRLDSVTADDQNGSVGPTIPGGGFAGRLRQAAYGRRVLEHWRGPLEVPAVEARTNNDNQNEAQREMSMERVATGCTFLDDCLGGGLPGSSTLLVQGDPGAGATEFALSVLRSVIRQEPKRRVRFATALRSERRVRREASELFENDGSLDALQVIALDSRDAEGDLMKGLAETQRGDVVVLESAAALGEGDEQRLPQRLQRLADAAEDWGVTVLILHTPGTLTPGTERRLADAVDGVLTFRWLDAGPARRRILTIETVRGLAPHLDNDQVPIFEVTLRAGLGFAVSRVKSVI